MSSIDYLIKDIGLLLMLCLFCFKNPAMLVILIHHCPTMLCLHLLDVGLQLLDSFRLGLLFHPVNPHFCVPMSGDKDFTNKIILNTNTLSFERTV